jgi:pimeloyl-ACP methyl ester carboxylesterase
MMSRICFAVANSLLATFITTGAWADESGAKLDEQASRRAVEELTKYIATDSDQRQPMPSQGFTTTALTRQDADQAKKLLWQDHVARIKTSRAKEMEARELKDGELKMPFFYKVFGDKPAGGRSLYISMHGGGGAPPRVNDRQWENQKRLYTLEEGVYLVPRAPTNSWNLWHQAHIDGMFDRLIENLIVFEDVNPNRVYLMGYSAGGDGVFQLAPRFADRLAAAAMMAGHPNETSPLGLRNLPFTIYMGGLDSAYKRNDIARQWKEKLAALHGDDPQGYTHLVQIYPDKGHWMDREDAAAIAWMAKYQRNTYPDQIVWKQDDVRHDRFYWLATESSKNKDRAEVRATRNGQTIDVKSADVECLAVRLNDDMTDLDQPITVTSGSEVLHQGTVARTIASIAKTLEERGDPASVYYGEIEVELPQAQ